MSRHHDGGARQRGDRVDVAAQHRWHLGGEHVAHHAAADAGEHAEQDGGQGSEVKVERLLRAGDGEQGEPSGVEHLHVLAHAPDPSAPDEGGESGEHGHDDVAPVADARRRVHTNDDVARDAAEVRGGKGEHQDAEQVETLAHGEQAAAQCEHEGAAQVQHQHEGAGGELVRQ